MSISDSSLYSMRVDASPNPLSDSPPDYDREAYLFLIPAIVVSAGVVITVGTVVYLRRRRHRSPLLPSTNRPHHHVTEITKALLDTIPIVTFQNQPDDRGSRSEDNVELDTVGSSERVARPASPSGDSATQGRAAPPQRPNAACPTCTDSFVAGQRMRVLPCGHRFHPACVDPWLLQRSSTCPMCRSDLRQRQEAREGTGEV